MKLVMTWSVSPRDLKCLASRALLCLAFTCIFVDAKPCAAGEVVTSPTSPPVPTLATARAELPFEIQSEFANGTAAGVITARLAFSFATVSTALGMPAAWCEFVTLHLNVKGCVYHGEEDADNGSRRDVIIYSGRKEFQPLADAYALDYDFTASPASATEQRVTLSAARGPVGTKDYRIEVWVQGVSDSETELKIAYQYHVSKLARLSFDTYLATIGARKVGFTVTTQDQEGRPVYVDGERGVMERNAMRYYLAIQAYLESLAVPALARSEWRCTRWFDLTEQYALQLHEIDRAEYLANKRREFRQQGTEQAALTAAHDER